jgi:hypothetical protein
MTAAVARPTHSAARPRLPARGALGAASEGSIARREARGPSGPNASDPGQQALGNVEALLRFHDQRGLTSEADALRQPER